MSFAIVQEEGYIRIHVYGLLTSRDLVELFPADAALDAGGEKAPDRLTDLRDVTEVQIRFADVEWYAQASRSRELPNAIRAAVLVRNAVQSGMVHMFRTLNENPRLVVEIFEDEAAALAWLRK